MSEAHRVKVVLETAEDGLPVGHVEVDGKRVLVNRLTIDARPGGVAAVVTIYDIDLEFTGQARVNKLCGYCKEHPLLKDKKTCGHGECVQAHCALA